MLSLVETGAVSCMIVGRCEYEVRTGCWDLGSIVPDIYEPLVSSLLPEGLAGRPH
jgi:hypothetical protein